MRHGGAWLLLLLASPALGWNAARLSEPVVIDGQSIAYPEFAIYLMPGQRVPVVAAAGATVKFADRPLTGEVLEAPAEPGLSRLEIHQPKDGETVLIHVFTLVPASRVDADGRLNGYRIGRYPAEPLRGLAIYRPPRGFIEVTEANEDVQVSPNFRLGQFVSKQDHGYPRYLVLRTGLLLKLEQILASLNRGGRVTDKLVVMSGFRTPFYNHAIGNVPYSRHTWGGAADIYIDEAPADGLMDDLDGNGRIDIGDARWLARFVDAMSKRGVFGSRIGGLGIYGSNAAHGPFIHVDVRGTAARW